MKDGLFQTISHEIRCTWRIGLRFSLGLLLACFLTGCAAGNQGWVQADLKTSINLLGGGTHQLVLAVPVEFYRQDIFSRLPDFSLITGVQVRDYRSPGRQGVQISQSFFRLGKLNSSPEAAHFLNKAYAGSLLVFQTTWRPGLWTRELQVNILVNPVRSDAIGEIFALASSGVIDARYTLELPGQVIRHNGQAVGTQAVTWQLAVNRSQTLEATARVLSVPFLLALFFAAGSSLVVIALLLGRRQRTPTNTFLPRVAGSPSRRLTVTGRLPVSSTRSVVQSAGRSNVAAFFSRLIAVTLGLIGLAALALAILSVLDGDWVPIPITLVGLSAYLWAVLHEAM